MSFQQPHETAAFCAGSPETMSSIETDLVTSPASLVSISFPVRPTTICKQTNNPSYTCYTGSAECKETCLDFGHEPYSLEFFSRCLLFLTKTKRSNEAGSQPTYILPYQELVNAHAGIYSNAAAKVTLEFLLLHCTRCIVCQQFCQTLYNTPKEEDISPKIKTWNMAYYTNEWRRVCCCCRQAHN